MAGARLDTVVIFGVGLIGGSFALGLKAAGAVFQKLLRLGVIVRPLAGYAMPDHLRVTVGLAPENARFLEAMEAVLKD